VSSSESERIVPYTSVQMLQNKEALSFQNWPASLRVCGVMTLIFKADRTLALPQTLSPLSG